MAKMYTVAMHTACARAAKRLAIYFTIILPLSTQITPHSAHAEPTNQIETQKDIAQKMQDVTILAPGIKVDLRYATANNFTKRVIYPKTARCYLRLKVAERLAAVQKSLEQKELGLKVYDCYRPRPVQAKLWALVPDERYVANPKNGSRHNRGAAIDLTLVDKNGVELAMPTPYDDFTSRAHRSYQDLPAEALKNRAILEAAMVAQGFLPLPTEWWHFDDPDSKQYPMSEISFDALIADNKNNKPTPKKTK